MPLVQIIVGSASDQPVMEDTLKTLESLGVEAELTAASAHRDPDRVREIVLGAPERGVEVFIAAAGGAAALPGVVASHTTLPVIGVPLASSELNGVDALHSIVQMPPESPLRLSPSALGERATQPCLRPRCWASSMLALGTLSNSIASACGSGEASLPSIIGR